MRVKILAHCGRNWTPEATGSCARAHWKIQSCCWCSSPTLCSQGGCPLRSRTEYCRTVLMRFVDPLSLLFVCFVAVTNDTYTGTGQRCNDHSPQDDPYQQERGWWPDTARSKGLCHVRPFKKGDREGRYRHTPRDHQGHDKEDEQQAGAAYCMIHCHPSGKCTICTDTKS